MALATSDSHDGVSSTGLTASATVVFVLSGGLYMVGVDDTGTAAGTLSVLFPDGQYVAVGTSTTFSAAGTTTVSLARGTYKWTAGGSITLGSFFCQPVPYRSVA
jgi:hypothetical protein